MAKITEELLNKIKESSDIEAFVRENEPSFLNVKPEEYLNRLMAEKGLRVAEVAARSGQGDYVYKVFSGRRKASRDVLIAICFGMGLSLDEAQTLLRVSSFARLDPRNRRDSVIIYGLCRGVEIDEVNDILFELGESTL